MKIKVTFLGPRQARFILRSIVCLDRTYSYLLVREGTSYNHYLRLHEGTVEVVRYHRDSENVKRLKAYRQSLRKAATTYMKTTLAKTDEAVEVLTAILDSTDDDQVNFLFDRSTTSKLEKPTKLERNKTKANQLTLEKICKELSVAPARVRAAFRRHKIEKPSGGWQWEKSKHDEVLAMIRGVL